MVYVQPGLEAAEQSINTAGVRDFNPTEVCTKIVFVSSVDALEFLWLNMSATSFISVVISVKSTKK